MSYRRLSSSRRFLLSVFLSTSTLLTLGILPAHATAQPPTRFALDVSSSSLSGDSTTQQQVREKTATPSLETFDNQVHHYQHQRKNLPERAFLGWVVFALSYGIPAGLGLTGLFTGTQGRWLLALPFAGPVAYGGWWIKTELSQHPNLAFLIMLPLVVASGLQIGSFWVAVKAHYQYNNLKKPRRHISFKWMPWFHSQGTGLALQGAF